MDEIQIHALATVLTEYTIFGMKVVGVACIIFLVGFFSGMGVGYNIK